MSTPLGTYFRHQKHGRHLKTQFTCTTDLISSAFPKSWWIANDMAMSSLKYIGYMSEYKYAKFHHSLTFGL